MIDRRELEAFEATILADEGVRRLLEDATRGAVAGAPPPSTTRLDPTMGLWLIGLSGLWLLAKVGIQHLRGMSESDLLQQRVAVVAEVKALGYDEREAAGVVERLLTSIRTRPDDDSVLKALPKMLVPGR